MRKFDRKHFLRPSLALSLLLSVSTPLFIATPAAAPPIERPDSRIEIPSRGSTARDEAAWTEIIRDLAGQIYSQFGLTRGTSAVAFLTAPPAYKTDATYRLVVHTAIHVSNHQQLARHWLNDKPQVDLSRLALPALQTRLNALADDTIILASCDQCVPRDLDLSRFAAVRGGRFLAEIRTMHDLRGGVFNVYAALPHVYAPVDQVVIGQVDLDEPFINLNYGSNASFIAGRDVSVVTFADDVSTVASLRRLPNHAYIPPPVATEAALRAAFSGASPIVFVLGHNENGMFRPVGSGREFSIPIQRVLEIAKECCKKLVFPISCESVRATGTRGVGSSFRSGPVVTRLVSALTTSQTFSSFLASFATPDTPLVLDTELLSSLPNETIDGVTASVTRFTATSYRGKRQRSKLTLKERLATMTFFAFERYFHSPFSP